MKRRSISFFAILPIITLVLFLNACRPKIAETEKEIYWFDHYSFFSNHHYHDAFKTTLLKYPPNDYPWDEMIVHYFEQRNYQPFWTEKGIQEELIQGFLDYLEDSESHGISPSRFYHDTIIAILNQLKSLTLNDETSLYQTLYNLEVSTMRSFLSYSNALQFGMTDPKLVNGGKWFFKTLAADTASVWGTLNALDTITAYMHAIQPKSEQYLILQKEMRRLLAVKDSVFETIPLIFIDSGNVHEVILLISHRLHLKGFDKADFPISDTFNASFLSALNRFRENNALTVSNELDEQTIHALNRPIQYYIDKIAVNLERLRWQIIPKKGTYYVAVNIADFTLQGHITGGDTITMKVCCGSTESNPQSIQERTKEGIVQSAYWESPMLYGEIEQLVLNPQWYVPEKITEDEYYHKLVANPDAFLEKEKMFIVNMKTNRPVLPDSIEWSKMKRKNFPYRLVQKSGRFNALGIIKFDFFNSESVYLHDTPNKRGFLKTNRALTHGCIRLQQPLELAKMIFELNNYDEKELELVMIDLGEKPVSEEGKKYWEEKELKEEEYFAELSENEKLFYRKLRPQYLRMKKKMPVYIEYFTCFANEKNQIQYREDVYYKDVSLLNQLRK